MLPPDFRSGIMELPESTLDKSIVEKLRVGLGALVSQYEQPEFIDRDPISIPHRFSLQQDQEITAFITAVFTWGRRDIIINKAKQLIELLDHAPYDWIMGYEATDLQRLQHFVHRTFNFEDLTYFLSWLKHYYQQHDSLEDAFLPPGGAAMPHIGYGLAWFHHRFFQGADADLRTRKHVSSPGSNSSCKRLCMMLRWLVRPASTGVDLGIWTRISPAQLLCPLDVHVERVAKQFGLLLPTQRPNWQAALQLTANLRALDAADPVRYDFALFGSGEARGRGE